MNELELRWVQWNFEWDQGQQDNAKEGTAWQGLVMAVRDPKTWLFTGILYAVSISIESLVIHADMLADLYRGYCSQLLPNCCRWPWLRP